MPLFLLSYTPRDVYHVLRWVRVLVVSIAVLVASTQGAYSQVVRGGVRDAEIEHLLRDYARPLLLAGNLNPSQVGIWLISDPALNAFVSRGQNIFFHTGLIIEAQHPSMVIGVMAHEIGHISGGHLARSSEAQAKAAVPGIITAILGLGSLLFGGGAAGIGLLLSGLQIGQRNYLVYNRTQEASADQTALRILELTQQSPQGLITLMDKLSGQEILNEVNQDPYIRSHPLSRERVQSYIAGAQNSKYFTRTDTPEMQYRHDMIKAKIYGFLYDTSAVFRRYKDESAPSRYARSIAHHRKGNTSKAITLIDQLITQYPENPWFYEVKGQIYFESGMAQNAIAPYRKAIALMPDEALLHLGLGASVLTAQQIEAARGKVNTAYAKMSILHLRTALRLDPESAPVYQQLARAFGLTEDIGRAEWATAEWKALVGDTQQAKRHAKRAIKILPRGTSEYLRAHDILDAL